MTFIAKSVTYDTRCNRKQKATKGMKYGTNKWKMQLIAEARDCTNGRQRIVEINLVSSVKKN